MHTKSVCSNLRIANPISPRAHALNPLAACRSRSEHSCLGPCCSQEASRLGILYPLSKRPASPVHLESLPCAQGLHDAAKRTASGLLAACLAVCMLFSPAGAEGAETRSQQRDGNLTIKFKASKDPAIREAQEALVQAWGYASTQYLDPNFNGVNWPQQLQVVPPVMMP